MIKVNGIEIKPRYFPDGTFRLNDIEITLYTSTVAIDWRWENPSEYMLLYFIVNHLRNKLYAQDIRLIMPYIPDARMDRVKDSYEVFTLKYFADFINSMNFTTVGVLDPHSDVAAALIDRVYKIDIYDFIIDTIQTTNVDYICYPDAGAMKRYTNKEMKKFLYGEKDRDWKTGKINSIKIQNPFNLTVEELKDAHILIIDDICCKGGTFYHVGKALKKLGVGQIDLYVSHCENAVFDGQLLDNPDSPITYIYTTDSLVRKKHPNIATLEILEDN